MNHHEEEDMRDLERLCSTPHSEVVHISLRTKDVADLARALGVELSLEQVGRMLARRRLAVEDAMRDVGRRMLETMIVETNAER